MQEVSEAFQEFSGNFQRVSGALQWVCESSMWFSEASRGDSVDNHQISEALQRVSWEFLEVSKVVWLIKGD